MDYYKIIYENIIPLSILIVPSLLYIFYINFVRYTQYYHLPKKRFSFKGIVTSVGDGDGFKVVHVPLLRSNNVKSIPSLNVRLAGIDAPEVRYFDKPEQPLAKEAKEYLKSMIMGRKVYIDGLKLDLYNRILAIVYVKSGWLFWKNVNLEMIKSGLACIYESNYTSFGSFEDVFRNAEKKAKQNRKGMWKVGKAVVLPMEFKKIHRKS